MTEPTLPKVLQLALTENEATYILAMWRVSYDAKRLRDAGRRKDFSALINCSKEIEWSVNLLSELDARGWDTSTVKKLNALADAMTP